MINEILVVRVVLGVLFLASAILKLVDLKGFFVILVQYGIVKGKLAKFSSFFLPFFELILGVLLFFGIWLKVVSIISLLFLISMTMLIVYAIIKKKEMDNCGCYGTAVKIKLGWKKFLEDVAWVLLALYLVIIVF